MFTQRKVESVSSVKRVALVNLLVHSQGQQGQVEFRCVRFLHQGSVLFRFIHDEAAESRDSRQYLTKFTRMECDWKKKQWEKWKKRAYSAQQKWTKLQKSARHEKELLRFQSIKNRRSQRSFLSGRFLKYRNTLYMQHDTALNKREI